ncbi:MAG: hypothetical protein R6V25_13015 [Desulfatiglandales bacterium]
MQAADAEGRSLNLEQTCRRISGKLASFKLGDCLDAGLILSGK